MNYFVGVFVCFAAVVCAVHAITDEVIASYVPAFERYQINFDKHYPSQEEYNKRLRAYAMSMEEVKKLNAEGDGAVYGETSRSDMLQEEKNYFSGLNMEKFLVEASKDMRAINRNSFPQPKLAESHNENNIPTEFSWFDTPNVKHPARSQAQCGSCWAFSAIGQLEMQAVLEGLDYYSLSVQQAIDCSFNATDHGCCGGFPGNAYETIIMYALEADYPYQLANWSSTPSPRKCCPHSCRSENKRRVVQINGYDKFTAMSAADLKKQIWMYGPISVWLNAPDKLNNYRSGVFSCSGEAGEGHYVVAVGFGSNYILCRNSWGATWGDEGNFKISTASTSASCNMLAPSQYLQMARVSVSLVQPENSSVKAMPFLTTFVLLIFLALSKWF